MNLKVISSVDNVTTFKVSNDYHEGVADLIQYPDFAVRIKTSSAAGYIEGKNIIEALKLLDLFQLASNLVEVMELRDKGSIVKAVGYYRRYVEPGLRLDLARDKVMSLKHAETSDHWRMEQALIDFKLKAQQLIFYSPEIVALLNRCTTLEEFITKMYCYSEDNIVSEEVIIQGENILGYQVDPFNNEELRIKYKLQEACEKCRS